MLSSLCSGLMRTKVTTESRRLNLGPLRCHRCGCEFRKSLDGAISETGKNRDYLAAVLPGLADRPIQCLPDLTPAAWIARHSSTQATGV